jgi:hypothetical protein
MNEGSEAKMGSGEFSDTQGTQGDEGTEAVQDGGRDASEKNIGLI